MLKYLYFTWIFLNKGWGKLVGVMMFHLVKNKRGYARSRVYNYVLQNSIYLPRLLERDWRLDKEQGKYFPHNQVNKKFKLKKDAYILYRKVSYLEYRWARWLWKWCDDDSNFDTHDGHQSEETDGYYFGTSWDLGDLRNDHPVEHKEKTLDWVKRNTYYNANYLWEEMREDDPKFFYHVTPKIFPSFSYNGEDKSISFFRRFNFKLTEWHFGFIPHSNSERKGRMVWFTEDIDEMDWYRKLYGKDN